MTKQHAKIVDIAEFQRRVAKGHRPGVAVRAVVGRFLPVAEQDANSRVRKFIFSDGSVDRYGDTINPRGWVYDKSAGSVALFGHDASEVENVIGRTQDEGVEGDSFAGCIRFATAAENPAAEMVLRLIDGGFINSVSVGFQPLEWKQTKDKSRPGGIDFLKQELLEVSVVPIPANRNALHQAKAAGIDIASLGLSLDDLPAISTKGLYEVSWLASLLESLGYLHDCVEWEAEYEGDGSAVPDKLAEALCALGAVLVEMTAEEVAELLGGEDDETLILIDDPVELASMSDAQKAMIKLAAIGRRARARKPLLERAGKVISADNEKKLRQAHDHMTQACEIVMGIVGDEGDTEEKSALAIVPVNDDDTQKTVRREAAAKLKADLGG